MKKRRDYQKNIMYFDDNITDYQVFIDIELSIFNLLRYLTDLNDIPLIIADRGL